mgnify:CR=1 FL=1
MIPLLQTLLDGLVLGGVYAFAAVGFSLIFGVLGVVNLTHGVFVVLGAYAALLLHEVVGLDPILGLPLVMAALFALGYALQYFLVTPLLARERAREPMSVLLMTLGLSLVLENLALMLFRGDYKTVQVRETSAVWIPATPTTAATTPKPSA